MRRAGAGVLLLLAGCSMNNRMHYLQQYAGEARRLEQQDRRFEANDYWGRASVKADSVLAHRRGGRDAGTALAVRGEAQSALGQCADAAPSLQQALVFPLDEDDREYAQLALGRCQVEGGAYDLAAGTVRPVAGSGNRYRRQQAQLILGSAERRMGQDSLAFVTLSGLPGRAAMLERAAAAATAGFQEAAEALVDSLAAMRDSTLPWDVLVREVGTRDPEAGSMLLTDLATRGIIPPEQLPPYLLADAMRLAPYDTVGQLQRLHEVLLLAPGSEAGVRARTIFALRQVAASSTVPDLQSAADSLAVLGVPPGTQADSMARAIRRINVWVDSSPPGAPEGDLRRFLAAETARDGLRAPALAASLFHSVLEGWPDSPYAAKAWLAARYLTGDTTTALAYQDSPYLMVLRGEDVPEFTQLEDSLARFSRAQFRTTSTVRPGAVPAGAARPRPGGGQVTPAPGGVQPGRPRGQTQRGRGVQELP